MNERLAIPHDAYGDIEYARVDGRSLLLDLYLPREGTGPWPLVVWIHGGAWCMGDKNESVALPLLRFGLAVASVEYRFSQEAIFPAQIHDCKAAVRWLRANAGRFGLDPDHIGAWGPSAGGHLAVLLGTSCGIRELEGEVGGNLHCSSRVQAVCDWFGPTDLTQMDAHALSGSTLVHNAPDSPESRLIGGPILENKDKAARANPLTYIRRGELPPFLIMHGDRDDIVPYHQSVLLYEALKKAGAEVELVTVAGAGHEYRGFEIVGRVVPFFRRHLQPEGKIGR